MDSTKRVSKAPKRYRSTVIRQETPSSTSRLLTFDRCGINYQPGHELMIHGRDISEDRQYSIASGTEDAQLQVYYRIIPDGVLTPQLAELQPGDALEFTGPFGSFLLRDADAPIVFIATGTGVAPAVSFLRSQPTLQMTLLHGVRDEVDLYERALFTSIDYFPCITGAPVSPGHFAGRVTACLETMDFPEKAHFYLCGSNDMIVDARKHLKKTGVADDRIFSEAYFFW